MVSGNTPPFSVIIPVQNDPEGIRTTLESLTEQTYPRSRYEVVIVDNRSTDTTPDVVREIIQNEPRFEVVFEDEIQSSYAARNRGIERASGEILAFIDADVSVTETWIAEIVSSMERHGVPYLGCAVEIVGEQATLITEFLRHREFPVERFIENDHFAPTCGLVVRRRLLDDVGPFDERLISGGDVEFGHRVYSAGYEQRYEPNVVVHHTARTTVRGVLSKFFRVGRGLAQYRIYHPDRFTNAIWWRPGGYLPPHPLRFYHTATAELDSHSLSKLLIFYLFVYLMRITRTAGAWYQFVRHGVQETAAGEMTAKNTGS